MPAVKSLHQESAGNTKPTARSGAWTTHGGLRERSSTVVTPYLCGASCGLGSNFIMGHFCQAGSLLVQALGCGLAVSLACGIHEGLVFSNRCRRTQLDKLVGQAVERSLFAAPFSLAAGGTGHAHPPVPHTASL